MSEERKTNGNMQTVELDNNNERKMSLVRGHEHVNELFDLFYENKFEEAYSVCDQYSSSSMIHAHGKAFLSFLYALLTLEKEYIQKGVKDLEESLNFSSKMRKPKSIVESVTSFWWKADASKYTEEELHAELIYAECNIMLGLLTFFGDQSILSLLKGAIKMTTANSGLKFCHSMLSEKKFESEELKEQLESGVYNGLGAFNLVLSMVPKKIMRILTVAGFSGDKNVAMAMIKRSTDLTSGLRCRVSVIVVEAFAMYFEQVMGIQEIDNNFMKSLLDYWGERFPKAVFVLFYLGKYELMRGNPKKAITDYTTCIGLQDEWKFVQKICRWDLVWCYAFLCDWDGAINEAKLLVDCSLYSPATNEYQIAVFKMMQMEDSGNEDLRREVDELMKSVPVLKQRFAGKTIPQEKFVCTRALQYFDENRKDGLVALMELFYIWNCIFALKTQHLAECFMKRIEAKIKLYEGNSEKHETVSFLALVKGVLFRNLDRDENAVQCFKAVIEAGKGIKKDTFIVPHAILELGTTYLKMKHFEEANEYLQKAKNDYEKFLNESIVNLRVSSALRQLQLMEDSTRL